MNGLPILQAILHEYFLQIRFDKELESKEFEESQFGKNQSEEKSQIML